MYSDFLIVLPCMFVTSDQATTHKFVFSPKGEESFAFYVRYNDFQPEIKWDTDPELPGAFEKKSLMSS